MTKKQLLFWSRLVLLRITASPNPKLCDQSNPMSTEELLGICPDNFLINALDDSIADQRKNAMRDREVDILNYLHIG